MRALVCAALSGGGRASMLLRYAVHMRLCACGLHAEVLDADYVHKGTGGSDLTYVYALISYSSSVSRGSGVSVWRSSGANGAFAIYYVRAVVSRLHLG